ncbi:MAG: helix-turn-helix domain-containing protein [Lachnospiraceae bacterium]|nr:helix-turn-helix domain-containing protein [Lachnospiraceae bacterium]
MDVKEASALFFQALCKDGIKPIICTAYEIFGCPVLLTDDKYALVCCYPEEKTGIAVWDQLMDYGTLCEKIIWTYQDAYLQSHLNTYEPFYDNKGLVEECPRIFGEVYTEQHQILGHVAIFLAERELGENDLALTRIFVDALRIRMSQKAVHRSSDYNYLLDLLEPGASERRKNLANQTLLERIRGNYCLVVTPVGESAAQKAFSATAIESLNNCYRNTVSTLYRDCIVTLFGEISDVNEFSEKEKSFLNSALRILKQSYNYIGISRPFDQFLSIDTWFAQGYLTALLKNPGITFYADAYPQQIFVAALQQGPTDTYLHPVLARLKQYDMENHTEYFETLRVYSLCLHNRESTAKELHIHRNTLAYRLGRIEEEFSLPFEETRTALQLLNSFQFLMLPGQE